MYLKNFLFPGQQQLQDPEGKNLPIAVMGAIGEQGTDATCTLQPPFLPAGCLVFRCPCIMRRGQPLAATSPILPELCQLNRLFCIYYGRLTHT